MRKIRLDIDALRITSFEPAPAVAAAPVAGSDSDVSWECSCDPLACLQTATTSD